MTNWTSCPASDARHDVFAVRRQRDRGCRDRTTIASAPITATTDRLISTPLNGESTLSVAAWVASTQSPWITATGTNGLRSAGELGTSSTSAAGPDCGIYEM